MAIGKAPAHHQPESIGEVGNGVAVEVSYGEDVRFRGFHVFFGGNHYMVCNLNGIELIVYSLNALHVMRIRIMKMRDRERMIREYEKIGHRIVGSDRNHEHIVNALFHYTAPSAV